MMERHNEKQKMELRLREEERKQDALKEKSNHERAEMEKAYKNKFHIDRKFSIHLSWILKEPEKYSSFVVYLHVPLSEKEISERMLKGFEDI